jgi:signal transduction histidine kinase
VGATGVWITLGQTRDHLSFEIVDDGPGFTVDDHDGRGLRNMHDRIEAIGGDLAVEAQPGRGARVIGSVQLPRLTG